MPTADTGKLRRLTKTCGAAGGWASTESTAVPMRALASANLAPPVIRSAGIEGRACKSG